jgi:hypothetical protein
MRKGQETERYLKLCFPWSRKLSFDFGHSEECSRIERLQTDVISTMNSTSSKKFEAIAKGLDVDNIDVLIASMKSLAKIVPYLNSVSTKRVTPFPLSLFTTPAEIDVSIPMVDVGAFFPFFALFQEPIRHAFGFDDEFCCNTVPDADETVFVRSSVVVN